MVDRSTCFLLRCPAKPASDRADLVLADRGHSLASFLPPPAAVGSFPIPNTEVKHMYADNTWRATPCCGARQLPAVRSTLAFVDRCHSLSSLLLSQTALGSLP